MHFHEYKTLRNQFLSVDKRKYPELRVVRARYREMKSSDVRKLWTVKATNPEQRECDELTWGTVTAALAEESWVNESRPFYNVWPIAVDVSKSIALNLPFSAIKIPFNTMLLRFAKGREPFGIPVAMVLWPNDGSSVAVICNFGSGWNRCVLHYTYDSQQQVQKWLDKVEKEGGERVESAALLIRLCVFIGLLANDEDLITPIVLAKDRSKYDSTDDPTVKKWLEDRASRRSGRGFDVGKKLQENKEKSPHWRNPHLCLFWTGTGRKTPIIQMRSGAVIQRVSMAEVPTGYFGPETELDDVLAPTKTPRESISKTRRFKILKRDNYRCQLCGKSADDGAKLHVDHRLPLAKGGSNEDNNLWTLCEQCNLGKSDTRL